jgi:D-alanine-D-alanine ligase
MSRPLSILVAFGGPSPEHEVSVLTGMQVMAALGDTSHTVIPLYVSKSGRWFTGAPLADLATYKDVKVAETSGIECAFVYGANGKAHLQQTSKPGLFSSASTWAIDVVIPAFHGSDGENGAFQGVCEVYNLPYTSSGVTASAIGMDKRLAKAVCRAYGFPVVDDVSFREPEWAASQSDLITKAEAMGYPLFVKPTHLGSSIGVSRAGDRAQLIAAVENAFRYDVSVLVEKAVTPLREINCSILGSPDRAEASVCEQPVGSGDLLSFKDKYQSGDATKGMASADRLIPAPITAEQTQAIQSIALGIFKAFGCSGVVRLDFLMNESTGQVYFNEINTQPGSFSFYLWQHSGVSFTQLVQRLVDVGLEQHRIRNGRVRSYETNLLSQKAVKGLKGLKGLKK